MELQGKVIAVLPEKAAFQQEVSGRLSLMSLKLMSSIQRSFASMFSVQTVLLSSTSRVVRNFWFLLIWMHTNIMVVGSTVSALGMCSV